jgi:hypothetical protein
MIFFYLWKIFVNCANLFKWIYCRKISSFSYRRQIILINQYKLTLNILKFEKNLNLFSQRKIVWSLDKKGIQVVNDQNLINFYN